MFPPMMGKLQTPRQPESERLSHLQKDLGFADLPVIVGAQHSLSYALARPLKVILREGMNKGMGSPASVRPPECSS